MKRSYLNNPEIRRQAKRKVRSKRYREEKPLTAPVKAKFRERLESEGWEKGQGGRIWYPPGKKPNRNGDWGGGAPHPS